MNEQQQNILNSCIELIQRGIPGVIGIYLFGSFGSAYQTPESDIDLAILSKGELDSVALWDLAQEIRIAVKHNVDLIDLRKASTVFRYQIVTSGSRIFCRDASFCDQLENTYMSMYLRFNEERKDLLEDRKYG